MYNEQLEQLIDAALEDGVLTEKEKQVLFKKAQAMGIDLDEFEMVLDARLVKVQKAEKEKAQAQTAAPKSNKLGDVKKCPACGAMVQSFQGACPECGYAFENIQANLSSQKLADAINKILEESNKQREQLRAGATHSVFDMSENKIMAIEGETNKQINTIIQNFPIPNSKADLIEFMTSLQPKIYSGPHAKVYYGKMQECVNKAQILFPKDETMQALVTQFNKKQGSGFKRWWGGLSKAVKGLIICGIIYVIIMIFAGIMALTLS